MDQQQVWEIEDTKLIRYIGSEDHVIIPEGIEEIGAYAFAGNKRIVSVFVPEGVKIVDKCAFRNCTALKDVVLMRVQSVKPYAFAGCTSLERIDMKSSSMKCITFCVFKGCSSLRSFTASTKVEQISRSAFSKCSNLERVELPETLKEIKRYAFSKCCHLKTVVIKSENTKIDSSAFHKCNHQLRFEWSAKSSFSSEAEKGFDIDEEGTLRTYFGSEAEIIVPSAAKVIGPFAFCINTSVKVIHAPFVERIERSAFTGCQIEAVDFERLQRIGEAAFWACKNLKKVSFSECLKYVGEDAFGNCHQLKQIVFYHPEITFEGRITPLAEGVEEVIFPEGLKKIPAYAFYGCDALRNIRIPDSVEFIGEGAFYGCKELRSVEIPAKVKELNWSAFDSCSGLREVVLLGKSTIMTGRTDEFCTASYRYFDQPPVKTAVIFMGLQGSGKTYYYNWHFAGKYEHINLDTLRTRTNERKMICSCIEREENFVIDNTNPAKTDRQRYIPMLKEAGYRVIGYYFESKLKDCIQRNEQRTGKQRVPNVALAATSNKLELPSKAEGFDELYFVERCGETVMRKRDWRE